MTDKNGCVSYHKLYTYKISRQISIIPKPELRGCWGDSPTKPQFKVTSAEVVIICSENIYISLE